MSIVSAFHQAQKLSCWDVCFFLSNFKSGRNSGFRFWPQKNWFCAFEFRRVIGFVICSAMENLWRKTPPCVPARQVLCRKYQVITPEQEVGTKSEYMVMAAIVLPQAASALQWKTSWSCCTFPLEAYKTSQTSDSKKKDLRKLQNLSPKNSDQDFMSWESLSAYGHKGKTNVSRCDCK